MVWKVSSLGNFILRIGLFCISTCKCMPSSHKMWKAAPTSQLMMCFLVPDPLSYGQVSQLLKFLLKVGALCQCNTTQLALRCEKGDTTWKMICDSLQAAQAAVRVYLELADAPNKQKQQEEDEEALLASLSLEDRKKAKLKKKKVFSSQPGNGFCAAEPPFEVSIMADTSRPPFNRSRNEPYVQQKAKSACLDSVVKSVAQCTA